MRPIVRMLAAGASAGWLCLAALAGPPRLSERAAGEEEQIRRRHEWFLSTRRAGTSSAEERATLRLAAAEATREALERQRARRTAGLEGAQNLWAAKGPASATFGGWQFGNVSGRVSSLTADWTTGTLWLGSASGGLWRSTDDGLSWTPVFDTVGTQTIGTVAVDPNDPQTIWVGTGENVIDCESYFGIGLWRSTDGGQTWQPRNGTPLVLDRVSTFANVSIDPRDSSRIVTGGRIRGCGNGFAQAGGVWTSDDAGATWTERLSAEVYEIARDPTAPDVLWAGTSSGVQRSTDGGLTWIAQTASGIPSSGTGRTEVAIAPSAPATVYALFGSPRELWRTTDGGTTWTRRTTGSSACDGQCWYNAVLRVHRTNPDVAFRGNIRLWRSDTGGSSWIDLSNPWGSTQTVHQDTHELLLDPFDPDTFWVGSDGGVWKTTNGGDSFQNRNANLNLTQFYAVGIEPGNPDWICGGAQDNSSLARTGGNVWDLQAVTGDGFVCWFDPVDPSWTWISSYPAGGYPNVWRSSNGIFGPFADVTDSGSGIAVGDRISWVTPYVLDPYDPATVYLGTHRVYRTDNRGDDWTQVGPLDLTGNSGSLIALEVSRGDADVLFSGSASGRVWRSVDRGETWVDLSAGLPARAINDVAADWTSPDRAFAVVGGFGTAHVWEWNAGSGWTARPGGLPDAPANTVLMIAPNDVVVGTDVGIFRSHDGGVTFGPFMDGLPLGLVVTDLEYDQARNVITAGTYGRGAWQIDAGEVGPFLLFDSIELPPTELDGDGDPNIEPGEAWSVRPRLRNVGGGAVAGVSATLATDTPGVTILEPAAASYGDLAPGAIASAAVPYVFVVAPDAECGELIAFDLVQITGSEPALVFPDRPSAFHAALLDHLVPLTETLFDDDFDGLGEGPWSHQAGEQAGCTFVDEWHLDSKDGAHGLSYHCGNGPGGTYSRSGFSWLHLGGVDSLSGDGFVIPSHATGARLRVVHWYDTAAPQDGGQLRVDGVGNGIDEFVLLEPEGGYPAALGQPGCNPIGGEPAFQGSSGGWVESTFDLDEFIGQRIWLAFVFASDRNLPVGEGWYVDQVILETFEAGDAVCHVLDWPGQVPPSARWALAPGGATIEASWDPACSAPSATYSIRSGDLDLLHDSGVYEHAIVGGACELVSPVSLPLEPGNRYYLVVPNDDGREGGAGADSTGAARPIGAGECGEPRVSACP